MRTQLVTTASALLTLKDEFVSTIEGVFSMQVYLCPELLDFEPHLLLCPMSASPEILGKDGDYLFTLPQLQQLPPQILLYHLSIK